MRKVRVLIVDDSRTMQLIVARILAEDREFVVVGTAGSAAEAEVFFGHSRIDVVTLDVEMPGTGGLEYLATLRKRGVPAVMVSTRVGKGDPIRAEALRRGAAACFPKSDVVGAAPRFRSLVRDAAQRLVERGRRTEVATTQASAT